MDSAMEADSNPASSLPSTTLTFSTPFPVSSYRLIEVSKDLAEKFKNGEKFIARGNPTANMTLCTKNETFRCRDVEITNTILLTEKMDPAVSKEELKINYASKEYLELVQEEGTPYLALKDLLSQNQFDFLDGFGPDKIWYTMDELLEVIQFSEEEIKKTLKEMPVVELDGTLRYLCRNVRSFLLNTLVEALDDESLSEVDLEKVNFEGLRRQFDETVDDCFVHWIMRAYLNPDHSVNQLSICRDRAIIVLEKEHEISQEAFNRQMLTLLPEGMDFNPEALRGIAIVNESIVRGRMYDYINVEDLPSIPKARLDLLFKIRDSWILEDLEPYVLDFCPNKSAVMPFLLKYCQQIKEGSNKVFVKRDDDF